MIYGGPERSNILKKTAANRKVQQNTRTTTEIEKYTANADQNKTEVFLGTQECVGPAAEVKLTVSKHANSKHVSTAGVGNLSP